MELLTMIIVLCGAVLNYTAFKLINEKLEDMQNYGIVNMKGDDDYDY